MILWFALFHLSIAFVSGSSNYNHIIQAVNSAMTTWKAGENFPEGTSLNDIQRLLGRRTPPAYTLPVKESVTPRSRLPDSFDARKKWPYCPTISHIYDQGACGSCWAMAGASTLADRFCIASKGNFTLPLSAHQLMSCCGKMCGDGCDGGDDYRGWVYFRKYGIVTGGDYNSGVGCQPYVLQPCEHGGITGDRVNCHSLPPPATPPCSPKCSNPQFGVEYNQDIHKVKRAYKVMSDPVEIMREIITHGPVQGGITVYEDFAHYKTGVYRHITGKNIGSHSVRIIGWGYEMNVPYWLVSNTWNTDWGDQGLFKILRGVNECGIEEAIHGGEPIL